MEHLLNKHCIIDVFDGTDDDIVLKTHLSMALSWKMIEKNRILLLSSF